MKQHTNESQTAKLIELGFPRPRIDAGVTKWEGYEPICTGSYTLGELIEMLPENVAKENEMPSTLNISVMHGEWCVQYAGFLGIDFVFCNTELIDALYNMIAKLKEEGVI